MKKLIFTALLTIMTLCMIAVSVSAASAPTASLASPSDTVHRGEEVVLSVNLTATKASTIGVQVSWNDQQVEWLGGAWESITGITLANVQTATKTASCAISPAADVDGKVLTLKFKVKDDVEFGTTKIDAVVLVKSDGAQSKINVSAEVDIVCKHEFTESVATDEFKKNDASCTEKKTYYYSCKCGEKGTTTFTVGEKLEHSFTKKVETDEFKKNDASCTEKKTYYYSCECGEKGTETFTVGDKLAHSFTKKVETDEFKKNDASCTEKKTYYYSCECGEKGTETFTVGDKLAHSFTKKVEDDKYKKNDASCTEKKTYYYSCECGEKGTETFTVGDKLAHSFTKKVEDDKYKKNDASCTEKKTYYYSCECGEKGTETFTVGDKLAHSFTKKVETDEFKKNDASCTEKATYYFSCECGEKGTETFTVGEKLAHSFTKKVEDDKYKKNDASCTEKKTYYYSCECGEKGTTTFTVGEKLEHSFTEKAQKSKFKKSDATCTEKAVYYYSCACGQKGTETFTVGNALGHNYAAEWTTNKTAHWHECSRCGDHKDEAAHIPGPEPTETTDQVCTTCSFMIAPSLGHTHDYPAEWKTNANEHWHECKCGEKKDAGAHVFDNACDTTCNTCTYVRTTTHSYKTEWSTNATHHWYECSNCGDKKDEAAHVAGPEATEESEQICTVCNFVLKEKLDHTHKYDSEWKSDEEQHWHECRCGEKSDVNKHDWNDGVITVEPTTEKEGVKLFSCRDCGMLRRESVKKLEKEKGGCSASAGGSLALIFVMACAPAVILYKKKKTH